MKLAIGILALKHDPEHSGGGFGLAIEKQIRNT